MSLANPNPSQLPYDVKIVLDADKQQAEAVGIVMALFAGALVSLAQIVEGQYPEPTIASQVLRVFLYGSIMLTLGGAFLSLLIIKMCTDLPLAYHQRQFRRGENANIHLPEGVEDWHRFGILLKAGMSRQYAWVDRSNTLILIMACVFTFVSLTFWVFLNNNALESTSLITVVIFVLVAIVVLGAFVITGSGEGWN